LRHTRSSVLTRLLLLTRSPTLSFLFPLSSQTKNKVLIVQFWQESNWPCKQLRPIFKRYSGLPGFKSKALFVEVDMDAARDVVAYADVTKVPTYQCYYDGELVDSYEGTAPNAMREFVNRNIKHHCGSGMALWQKLVVMAAAAAGAGIAYVFARGDQSTESIAQNARNEILSIKQRIVTAQGRLKNLEKANRGKQAKVQRKLIEQLNAQRRALERTQQNAEKSGGKSGGKSGMHAELPSEGVAGKMGEATEGRAGAVAERRKAQASGLSFDELARIRYKKRQGEVLYSDEEDAIADGVAADELKFRF
jgi:thiol-disulfide isomerase/thioredoxin